MSETQTQTMGSEKKETRPTHNLILVFALVTSVVFGATWHTRSALLAGITLFGFMSWFAHLFAYVIWNGKTTI